MKKLLLALLLSQNCTAQPEMVVEMSGGRTKQQSYGSLKVGIQDESGLSAKFLYIAQDKGHGFGACGAYGWHLGERTRVDAGIGLMAFKQADLPKYRWLPFLAGQASWKWLEGYKGQCWLFIEAFYHPKFYGAGIGIKTNF